MRNKKCHYTEKYYGHYVKIKNINILKHFVSGTWNVRGLFLIKYYFSNGKSKIFSKICLIKTDGLPPPFPLVFATIFASVSGELRDFWNPTCHDSLNTDAELGRNLRIRKEKTIVFYSN